MNQDEILEKLVSERARQYNIPGSEWDIKNKPNDWASIVMKYLSEIVRYKGRKPRKTEVVDGLVKSGAIIIAALENISRMVDAGEILDDEES